MAVMDDRHVERHNRPYCVTRTPSGAFRVAQMRQDGRVYRHINAASSLGAALVEQAFGATGEIKNDRANMRDK